MFSSNNQKLFISILFFPVFVLPIVLSSPISNSPYDIFLHFATENKCVMPKDLKLPFKKSSDSQSFKYLSFPLNECRTSVASNKDDEVDMLCTEIFDVLKNITCVRYNQSLSMIESDHYSKDVCLDFESLKDILPQKDNYLSKGLSNKAVCNVLCSKGKYELCKMLLWSYDTLMKINHTLYSEEQVQKNGNQSTNKVSSNEVSEKAETISQNMNEPDTTKVFNSVNPQQENLPESDVNKTDQESHNSKISGNLDETDLPDTLNKKDVLDHQVENKASYKTTSITKNIATTIQQNKSDIENEKLPPKVPENNIKLSESENSSVVNPQTENLDDNDSKIGIAIPQKEITVPQAKLDKNSLTSNENEGKDKQNIKNLTADNLQSNGNDNVHSKEVKEDSNVGSKASEKSAEPVSPATANDNELKSSNFPEGEDKPTPKHTGLEGQEGKEIKKPKQTDYESPNEDLPDTDSKLPEPSTLSTLPDEDIEHQENRDQGQYDDIENDGDYVKSEYDNSLNLPSKNKESVVQSPIIDVSNQMTNGYSSNINTKDNIGRISEEIAMIAPFPEQEDSHFFFYFLSIVLIIMAGYLIFHNKQKIIALIVEGRHERRRRSHGAGYKKLETK